MALASLRYEGHGHAEENRAGIMVYDGAPQRFNEWKFQTEMEIEAAIIDRDDKKRREKTADIVKALRKDAFDIAMDMGKEDLMKKDGVPNLIVAIGRNAFPRQVTEAKDLYKAGHSETGILSRQSGESIPSYINRRRRWWRELKKLDNSIQLSAETLGELLLDCASLTRLEIMLIKTTAQNDLKFDVVANAMEQQLADLHREERRQERRPMHHSYGHRHNHHGNRYKRSGFMGGVEIENDVRGGSGAVRTDSVSELYGVYPHEGEPEESATAHLADTNGGTEDDAEYWNDTSEAQEPEDVEELEEAAFASCIGLGMTEQEVAEYVQAESCAFVAHQTRYYRSDSKGKSKGKGRGKGRFLYGKGGTSLSIDQRRRAMAQLKAKTRCNACGQMGHWTGDKECPKGKSVGKGSTYDSHHSGKSSPPTHKSGISGNLASEVPEDVPIREADVYEPHKETLESARIEAFNTNEHQEWKDDQSMQSNSLKGDSEPELDEVYVDEFTTYVALHRADTMMFGELKGTLFTTILNEHPEYLRRLLSKQSNRLLKYEKEFLDWAQQYHPQLLEIPEAEHLGVQAKKALFRRRRMPEKLAERCADGCKEFTRLGSNHLKTRTTCLKCGHYETESNVPQEAVHSPSTCPHDVTDHRGSTKKDVLTYCRQCKTYIDSRPRSEYEKAESTATKIRTASTRVISLASTLLEEHILDTEQMKRVDAQYRAMMEAHFCRNDSITTTLLKSMLVDAIDQVIIAPSQDSAAAAASFYAAMMAPQRPFNGVQCLDNLQTVDIFADRGIWVCLDEGCNSNCHGSGWRENTMAKLQMRRLSPYVPGNVEWVSRQQRTYSGIGNTKVTTAGKWRMPGVIQGFEHGKKHAIILDSNEQDGNHPMLLSQHTQMRLKLVKDMEGLTLYSRLIDDYIDLKRAKGSGLLVFRIDNWPTKWNELQESMHTIMWDRIGRIVDGKSNSFELDNDGKHMIHKMRNIKDPNWPRWPVPEDWKAVNMDCNGNRVTSSSHDEPDYEILYAPDKQQGPTRCIAMPASVRPRRLTFAVLGLMTYALKKSTCVDLPDQRNCEALIQDIMRENHIKDDQEGRKRACNFVNFDDEEQLRCMKKHLVENHTDIRHDQEFVFVNCLDFGDPHHNPKLRSHLGTHPSILKDMVYATKPYQVRPFHEHVIRWIESGSRKMPHDLCIVFVCKRESHRSVAMRWLYHNWLEQNLALYLPEEEHVQLVFRERRGPPKCNSCQLCLHADPETQSLVRLSAGVFEAVMKVCHFERIKGKAVQGPGARTLPTTAEYPSTEEETVAERTVAAKPMPRTKRKEQGTAEKGQKVTFREPEDCPEETAATESTMFHEMNTDDIRLLGQELTIYLENPVSVHRLDRRNLMELIHTIVNKHSLNDRILIRMWDRACEKHRSQRPEGASSSPSNLRNHGPSSSSNHWEDHEQACLSVKSRSEKSWCRDDRKTKVRRGMDTSRGGVHERKYGKIVYRLDPEYNYSAGRSSGGACLDAYHWLPVERCMRKWDWTHKFPTDLEPYELSDSALEEFFLTKSPKEIQYYSERGISDPNNPVANESCVRVNVKVHPIDTKIGVPKECENYVKTTLIQRKGMSVWELIEDRSSCYHHTAFTEDDDVRRALIFLQPPRTTRESVCFVASVQGVDLSLESQRGNLVTMSKEAKEQSQGRY